MSFTVISPGAQTLVQDAGRPGYAHLGVPASGAADAASLALANRLVGNPADAAALEITLAGPVLEARTEVLVAVVGAPVDVLLDDIPVPVGHSVVVGAGQRLQVGAVQGGVRAYLAVAGGIDVPAVLGSRSTCTLSGLGPAPLTAGAVVPVGTPPVPWQYRATRCQPAVTRVCRVLPGPHAALFAPEALEAFSAREWIVSQLSSRVGVRLDGHVPAAPNVVLPSLGMVTGAVQIPPDGRPVLLGPDHGSTGGYPVLAVVIGADLPVPAQARPSTPLRFTLVTPEQAAKAWRAAQAARRHAVLELDAVAG